MNKLVLVVDDDEPLRRSLCDSLEDEGYRVVGAANGAEALEYLRRAAERPCVIFLDLMMPVMNGWQFLGLQKGDPGLSAIPVVVITANGSVDRASIDAKEVVWKPLDLDTLLDTAGRYCPC
jgi:CheY-like chemotaxis protein